MHTLPVSFAACHLLLRVCHFFFLYPCDEMSLRSSFLLVFVVCLVSTAILAPRMLAHHGDNSILWSHTHKQRALLETYSDEKKRHRIYSASITIYSRKPLFCRLRNATAMTIETERNPNNSKRHLPGLKTHYAPISFRPMHTKQTENCRTFRLAQPERNPHRYAHHMNHSTRQR